MNVVLPAPLRAEQAGDPRSDLSVEARERDRLAVTLHDAARRDDGMRFGLRQIAHAPNATCHFHLLPQRGVAALAQSLERAEAPGSCASQAVRYTPALGFERFR